MNEKAGLKIAFTFYFAGFFSWTWILAQSFPFFKRKFPTAQWSKYTCKMKCNSDEVVIRISFWEHLPILYFLWQNIKKTNYFNVLKVGSWFSKVFLFCWRSFRSSQRIINFSLEKIVLPKRTNQQRVRNCKIKISSNLILFEDVRMLGWKVC